MTHPIEMPKLGFDMAEGTLVRWVKKEGEPVAKGDVIAEIETDKATVEVESHYSGVMRKLLVEEGTIVPIGKLIAVIGEADEPLDLAAFSVAAPASSPAQTASPLPPPSLAPLPSSQVPTAVLTTQQPTYPTTEPGLPSGLRASPLARKLATDRGLDLRAITGTGPGGRITKLDVESFAGRPETVAPTSGHLLAPAPEDTTVPLTRLRQAIARRMTESKQTVPHFYITADIDMAAVMKLREELNAVLAEQGLKLSVNDFIVKACALALREYPNLNATFQGDKLLRHGQINVGIAVAVEGGLLTIVTRDTDRKPLARLSAEAKAMIKSAREGKVKLDDISGSTFSVSNLDTYEVDHFIAIINPPEGAILAVGSVMDVPVVKEGQIVVGTRMKATVSADHRVTDGAEAAQFLQAVRRNLEQPLRLMV